jgi:hypothetical protein
MKQLKVGLTDDVRAELDRAAAKHGVSTSVEARLRLETSLGLDYYDSAAIELAEHVLYLADSISRFETGGARPVEGWQKSSASFGALKVAIETWLDLVKPLENKKSGADFDPPTLGRSLAMSQHRRLLEKLKVDRDMREFRQSVLDEPAFTYSDSRGNRGTMSFRQMDEADAKLSDKERLQIREEAEAQLDAEYRRENGRPRPKRS